MQTNFLEAIQKGQIQNRVVFNFNVLYDIVSGLQLNHWTKQENEGRT